MQGQLPDLVVTQPIVLQGGDIVALGFLLPVQRERHAVDVGFPDQEALLGLLIGHQGNVQGFFRTADQVLLDVEVAHGHDDVFFHADLFLLCRGLGYAQVALGDVVLSFADAPVHQRDGNRDGNYILLQRIFIDIPESRRYLVESDTGIYRRVEHGFFLCAVYFLFCFQDALLHLQKFGVVLAGQRQGFFYRNVQVARTGRQPQADFLILLEVQVRGQAEHGALQGNLSILQCVLGIDRVQLQGEQVFLTDGGYLVPFLSGAIERIGICHILFGHVVFHLCHGQGKEVSSCLLADAFHVV